MPSPILANLAVSAYNVAVIWLMQVIIYPSWPFVPTAAFPDAQGVHFWRLFIVVFPQAALATALAVLLLRRRPPGASVVALRLGLVVQVALWVLTAALWGRWQGEIAFAQGGAGDGFGPANARLYDLLVDTHWLRVALITAYMALAIWLARTTLTPRTSS